MMKAETDLYIHGIDLLNRGEYFEAHEVLEYVWRSASPEWKLFTQALVQVAVSMHHQSTGNFNGARSVLGRSIRNFSGFETGWRGLDLPDLRSQLLVWQQALDAGERATPIQVRWLKNASQS